MPYQLKATAEAMLARGLATKAPVQRRKRSKHSDPYVGNSEYELDSAAITALTEPFTIWLPNTLIDGAANEVPPVELIRQTRSLSALRLLIELYAVQFLPTHGGVPRELLKRPFERAKVGEQGAFVVWGFRSKSIIADGTLCRQFRTGQNTVREDGRQVDAGLESEFWPAVHILENLGLVECVGMLLDGGDDAAEVIHPFAKHDGEAAERELASAAGLAATLMITEGQRQWAEQEGYDYLVPVRRHIAHATLVEIYRLRYRPHTKATAAWYAEMQKATAKHLAQYLALVPGPAKAMSA
jgi:hypothetical protein